MKADTYDAKVTRNINLNGAEDTLKQVLAVDTDSADKPVAENGATPDTSSATVIPDHICIDFLFKNGLLHINTATHFFILFF